MFEGNETLEAALARNVHDALMEDIGHGDWTAQLVPSGQRVQAQVVAKEGAVIAGRPWFDACVKTLDPDARLDWSVEEGQRVERGTVVVHIEGDRFPIGELNGAVTERATRISEAFTKAGLKCPLLDNVRAEMWLKLWGNLTFNPISALTHATLQDICEDPYGKELASQMMKEAQAVAEHLGITFRVPLEKRIEGARKVGKHKTSMLQDVEAGREPEIDALVGSVVELARLTDTPTPHIDAVHGLVKLLARTMTEQRGQVRLLETAALAA